MNPSQTCSCFTALKNFSTNELPVSCKNYVNSELARHMIREHLNNAANFGNFTVAVTNAFTQYISARATVGDYNVFDPRNQVPNAPAMITKGLQLRSVLQRFVDECQLLESRAVVHEDANAYLYSAETMLKSFLDSTSIPKEPDN